ncbi:uncharacterized protein TNCV_4378891 [Trichonephila clavipes]|nr:uncharacterized protein TNCV_4378891 [Trichonephila clavipes]
MGACTLACWTHHYDLDNIEYHNSGSPSIKKFKTLKLATKVMLAIFWDVSGVLYTEFLTKGLTVNSDSLFRGLATAVSAVSMIWSPQATRDPTCVYTDPLTGISFLKKGPEAILIEDTLKTSFASEVVSNVSAVTDVPLTKCSHRTPKSTERAAVAKWSRYRIVAEMSRESSRSLPLKTPRVGQRCTLNLSSAETSFRGVVWYCQAIYSQFGLAIHQNDHQARRRFVEWAQNEIAVVPDFPNRILFTDEAHFWLNGYVNKQNCRIWSEANPQVYGETPLHPEKLTVWCALWAGGILLQKR